MADNHVQGTARKETPSGTPEHTELLDRHECWDLLRRGTVGRLAVVVDGEPDIFPINYVVDHGTVVFRTDAGRKLSAAANRAVAFEADGYDAREAVAWSVVVHGVGSEIRETDEVIDAMGLSLAPWQQGAKARFIRIKASAVTGRRIHIQGGPTRSALPG
ncbi:pyridoxamine 5'-phosphate oxidase family protein [Terrabacter sp. MAHUQ-38]|uniref:pyridoxamine 5'-phosphate oxidase family protein n=1 Tax=unclassified Terrabacter TaxID=2630222 RepID=UPI00165DC9F9|nr:pyridoxamine 5'-phosphate oxidase family protein [Terrabacter sp. MAHUQ-38]MBC9821206.1 pyridoxamine 5'-phosphate oxidase family protein [Terrabacter sp. MAHUQ-38]